MEYLRVFAESAEKLAFSQVGPYEQVTTKNSLSGFSLDGKAATKYYPTTKFWRLRFRRD
jgi:hypothetical protein